MKFFCCPVRLVVLAIFLLLTGVGGEAPAQLTAERVRESIRGGLDVLRSLQNADGTWDEHSGQPGGVTALCALAMVSAGERPDSPGLKRAFSQLRAIPEARNSVYSTSLIVMALAMSESPSDTLVVKERVRWLVEAQVKSGPHAGGWGYGSGTDYADNSNAQFAILALHEAALLGIEIDESVWEKAREYWVRGQHKSGGWGYKVGHAPSGSMTCAGISSMIIIEENLRKPGSGDQLQCCGSDTMGEEVERAIEWFGRKFSSTANPTSGEDIGSSFLYYYLYGIERAGRLSGRRFFGEHDWYREGAEFLLAQQSEVDNRWRGAVNNPEARPEIATSFALLFLSKGRWPVAMAKYRHGSGNNWDKNPKGVHFLVRALEKSWKQKLTWQSVEGERAEVNDLLQSPVVFISGQEGITLLEEQQKRLVDYVNQGGFLFVVANDGDGCDGKKFDAQIREYLAKMFPQSSMELLPPEHPVWFAGKPVLPDPEKPLYGIQACCRTSVIYCPANLVCHWELSQPSSYRKLSDSLKAKIDNSVQLGVNVMTYATNRDLKDKLDRPQVANSRLDEERLRDLLTIPKLAHSGGADDAQSAWANMLMTFGGQLDRPVNLKKELVAPDDPRLVDYPILFMHGRKDFQFTNEQKVALLNYLKADTGGFILVDSICGSRQFSEAVRREFTSLAPNLKFVALPKEHRVFTTQFSGFDLSRVVIKTPDKTVDGAATFRETTTSPMLEALEIDGRIAVIFSPFDLSCAMENAASLECEGYRQEDAAKIGINILLYALQQ